MYYDKSSIFEAKKGIIAVWTKNILSTDSKKQYFSILQKIGKAPDDPSRLSYYKSLMEIDSTNKKFRYVYAVFYDEQDNIIYPSSENETSAWNTIEPDSVGEKLMNLVSSEFVISKEKNVTEQVEESVPPKESAVAAKIVEPVPAKDPAPVAPKETALDSKVEKPAYLKEHAPVAKVAESVAPKEVVVAAKAPEPVPPKETVTAAPVEKSVYPKETVLAAKISESIPLKETVVASKVEKPVSTKEAVVTTVTVPDKKLIADKNNPQEAKVIPGEGDQKTGFKEENSLEAGNMETGRKTANREVQDQKSKLPAESHLPVAATARETGRDGRFIAFDNQTVLDTKTNLMWAAKDNGRDINWYNAKRYCEGYRGGGYTDWRMPTQDELAQLYDAGKAQRHEAQQNPLHLTGLIRLTDCCPWSSKTRGSEAAYFDFTDGTRWWFLSPATSINRAIPVRSAK